jgi:GntR family transcriptional regulator / MocR family aminotransferase
MILKLDGRGALFEQLARSLKREILAGRFAPGSQLPATRMLAKAIGVSRNTVLGAYELLCAEQLASARPGSGTRVTHLAATPRTREARVSIAAQSRYSARTRKLRPVTLSGAMPSRRYNLQYGEPLLRPQLFASWRRKLLAAAIRSGPRYPAAAGLHSLRRAIADYLLRRRGVSCAPNDVLIVSGTQQALNVVARCVLDAGQSAVIEDPHYELVEHALLAHGARVVRVRVDAEGLVAAELPGRPPRLIYVTPSHQFPSGAVMSLDRRLELLNYATKHNCWVFEDDYDGEFHYDGRPLPALQSLDVAERVIYSGTFSKTLFPGLRLGYIVCPPALRADLHMAKTLEDLGCSSIEQAALAAFLESRQYEKHLRESLVELRNRRHALLEGLSRHLGDRVDVAASAGGMHIVVWFRNLAYAPFERLLARAAELQLGLHPIHRYYQKRPPRPGLMLGFAGLTPGQLGSAMALLGRCLNERAPVVAPHREG